MRSSPRSTKRSTIAGRGTDPSRIRPHWRRQLAKLEARRRQAAALFRRKIKQAEVARRLGVSRQSVSRWFAQWARGGRRALANSKQVGRPARLSGAQQAQLKRALLRGAQAHGYATNLWTLARVAEVIEHLTGIRYHPGHVWRLLHQLGWTRQKPARRAVERDEQQIQLFREQRWPRLKKTPDGGAPGWFSSTKPGSPSSLRSVPPGRRKGRPRSSTTDSGTG